MNITREESSRLFNMLVDNDKKIVINNLISIRNDYLKSGAKLDLPYFFWSLNNSLFDGVNEKEIKEFLDINNSNDFGIQCIYYLSRYIITKKG